MYSTKGVEHAESRANSLLIGIQMNRGKKGAGA